jgi:uncharacterized protein (UPF0248 family)
VPGGKAKLRAIIDEHLHREGRSMGDLVFEVADRAVAGGCRALGGSGIAGASGGFIELRGGGRIPFHKVRRVTRARDVLYRRALRPP